MSRKPHPSRFPAGFSRGWAYIPKTQITKSDRNSASKSAVRSLVSKWRLMTRLLVLPQFRRFGLAALAYYFFRFVSWPQLSSFEGMGKNRHIEPRNNCRSSLCGNKPHVPHVRAHVHPIRAGKRQPRGNCRANVRSQRTSIGARKNARAGDVRGAE